MLFAERIIPTGIMGCYQVTLDIAQDLLSHSLFVRLILWSETILRRNAFSKPVIERKMSVI